MKLTKGKITKLLSKKKQTKKGFNKNKYRNNTKTFRRTRPVDLSHRTLKNFRGGAGNEEIASAFNVLAQHIADTTSDTIKTALDQLVSAAVKSAMASQSESPSQSKEADGEEADGARASGVTMQPLSTGNARSAIKPGLSTSYDATNTGDQSDSY
jgi:hypothetical protein